MIIGISSPCLIRLRHRRTRSLERYASIDPCNYVIKIEPHLQPLTEEVVSHNSAITNDGARLNIAMYMPDFFCGGSHSFEPRKALS